MIERQIISRNKGTPSNFSNPSLVPSSPTLANPVKTFGLESNQTTPQAVQLETVQGFKQVAKAQENSENSILKKSPFEGLNLLDKVSIFRPKENVQRQEESDNQESKLSGENITNKDKLEDDVFVSTTINSFNDEVLRSQIGDKIKNQRAFLKGMQTSLGSLDSVIQHFQAIRKADVPGNVHLHESAATRLEMVAAKLKNLGSTMPSTDIALGLRGRYRHPHKRGLMAHPCGFALDYRAFKNPHITDPRLVKLLQDQSNGAISFNLGSYGKRRSLIKQIGSETAAGSVSEETGKKAEAFLTELENQYDLLTASSNRFKSQLPETRDKILNYDRELEDLDRQLMKISKQKKNNRKNKEDIEHQETELRNKREQIESQVLKELPTLFAPWLKEIEQQIKVLEKSLNLVFPDTNALPTKKELEKQRRQLNKTYRALLRQQKGHERTLKRLKRQDINKKKRKEDTLSEISDIENNINELETALADKTLTPQRQKKIQHRLSRLNKQMEAEQNRLRSVNSALTELDGKMNSAQSSITDMSQQLETLKENLENVDTQLNTLPQAEELTTLKSLKEGLSSDTKFVFEGKRSVQNPSIAQLLKQGFFNPDEAPTGDKDVNPNKHGFDKLFIRTMAEYGFDLGVSWNPGSVDPMHFELVEGVDSLKNP
jgi:uncharacterized coiled-coil DUF342 family protein